MSAELLDTPISYEQLEDIEDDFEEVELELLRQGDKMTKALYAKREKIVSQIPNFWALVMEQSPADIDEYIQPTDAALLLNSLKSLSVERFELPNGDPRSLAIKFEFSENEHFENETLEKKFYWRRSSDGWAGHVSEPVDIKWKEGKDLTNGLLGLSRKVWEEDKAAGGKSDEETETKKQLREKMDNTGLDAVSFFCWFGFRGPHVSDEEHAEATKKEQEKRQARKDGKEIAEEKEEEEEDDEEKDDEYEFEIFPTADDLALCIAEDLWPNAIKYFTQAQDDDAMSDIDFEEMMDDEMDEDEEEDEKDEEQPSKKRKA